MPNGELVIHKRVVYIANVIDKTVCGIKATQDNSRTHWKDVDCPKCLKHKPKETNGDGTTIHKRVVYDATGRIDKTRCGVKATYDNSKPTWKLVNCNKCLSHKPDEHTVASRLIQACGEKD